MARVFGFKCAWLAAKSVSAEQLADAMGIAGLVECDWEVGIIAVFRDDAATNTFITPPIDGWTLAVSWKLRGNALELADLATAISAKLQTEVQVFTSHRVVDVYGWVVASSGVLLRGHIQEDDEWSVGEPMPQEEISKEMCGIEDLTEEGLPEFFMNEDYIIAMAEQLSVNPMTLDERTDLPNNGYAGMLPD